HGIHVAPRLGQLRSVVVVQLLSLPFAIVAGVVPVAIAAAAALMIRAGLMYGSSSTYRAFTISSFSPAERAGVTALLAIAWNATAAVGSLLSGAIRSWLGDAGWTVNLLTLVGAYTLAAILSLAFFARHEPRGDAITVTVPHSPE
ncbi:MAG: hypothetical protein HYX56_05335, partial [Chloroflexi bacterium]|nr:hypothetical protein [Chloroflexota bacterium]